MVSLRGMVRTLRPTIHSIPIVGAGLRYLKRLVMMPWNFHKLHAAWSAEPPVRTLREIAESQREATQKAAEKTTHDILTNFYDTTRNVMRTQVTWSEWNSKSIHDVHATVQGISGELRGAIQGLQQTMVDLKSAVKKESSEAVRVVAVDIATEIQKLNETHAVCYDSLADSLRDLVMQQQSAPSKQEFDSLKLAMTQLEKQLEMITRQLHAMKATGPVVETNGKDHVPLRRSA